MTEHGRGFDNAQRSHDQQEPEYVERNEECEICIFYMFGHCQALGDTDEVKECPSFMD